MVDSQRQLFIQRLIATFVITAVIADTYPQPNLAPGLLESTFRKIENALVLSKA